MDYKDVWKKKMLSQGIDETQSRLNSSKDFFRREFRNDPSYKSAILYKLNLDQESIDIRIKNVDKSANEKRILFLPDTQLDVGSLVEFNNKVFLITEFEDNSVSPYSKAKFCNQTLNWKGLDKPIPCWCDNSSYGTKGVVDSNYIKEYDGKILFYTQYNEKTAIIKQDMRFMFDHSKTSVYKVVDVNRVVTGNVLRLVMDKEENQEERDDVVNNIAYNEWLEIEKEEPTLGNYGVKSYTDLMEINKWDTNIFTVVDEDGVEAIGKWNIEVDYKGNPSDCIIINQIGSNCIKLNNNGYMGIEIELIFTKDDIKVSQMVRLVR